MKNVKEKLNFDHALVNYDVGNKHKKGKNTNSENETLEKRKQILEVKLSNMRMAQMGYGYTYPKFLRILDIKLIQLNASMTAGLTLVEELSNHTLSYKHPYINASASVEIPPLPVGTEIQIGWIQVCTYMSCLNYHGKDQILSWEVPEMVSGDNLMVNDSNATLLPWYTAEDALFFMQGPTENPTIATVDLDDSPYSLTSMCIPNTENISTPTLTFVYRKQRFYSYLVLKNMRKDNYEIIKVIHWSLEVAIELDPLKKLGNRVVFVGPCEINKPLALPKEYAPPLDETALTSPPCNQSQLLVLRSKTKEPVLVKKPEHTTVDLDKYLSETPDYTSEIFNITKKNFMLYYVSEPEQII